MELEIEPNTSDSPLLLESNQSKEKVEQNLKFGKMNLASQQLDNTHENEIRNEYKEEKRYKVMFKEKDSELAEVQNELKSAKSANLELTEKVQELKNTVENATSENQSLKTRIKEITDDYKSELSQNAKTMTSLVKMHEIAMNSKISELNIIKQELQNAKSKVCFFSQKIVILHK